MSGQAERADRRAFLRGGFLRDLFAAAVPAPTTTDPAPRAPEATRPVPARPNGAQARVVSVAEGHCLAYRGLSCSTCRERCPVAGAIEVELGRPRVDPALCDGCGQCIAACPAPVLALRLTPRPAA